MNIDGILFMSKAVFLSTLEKMIKEKDYPYNIDIENKKTSMYISIKDRHAKSVKYEVTQNDKTQTVSANTMLSKIKSVINGGNYE